MVLIVWWCAALTLAAAATAFRLFELWAVAQDLRVNSRHALEDRRAMQKDIDELRQRFGKRAPNPRSVVGGAATCMVAADHPILRHPDIVRVEHTTACDDPQWHRVTKESVDAILAKLTRV